MSKYLKGIILIPQTRNKEIYQRLVLELRTAETQINLQTRNLFPAILISPSRVNTFLNLPVETNISQINHNEI